MRSRPIGLWPALLVAWLLSLGGATSSVAESSANRARRPPPPASHPVEAIPAPRITAANLMDHEAVWPFRVALTKAWKPAGHVGDFGWGVGTLGVLVRIDPVRGLRVDFGRFGVRWVPIEVTDAVELANRLRSGEQTKIGANLAMALNNRLLDPSGATLERIADDLHLVPRRVYVLVFADPASAELAAIARASAVWSKLAGAEVALIALGDRPDAHIYKLCHDAQWKGSFLMGTYAAAYARAQLDSGASTPRIQVASPEGRLLLDAAWSHGAVEAVARAASAGIVRAGVR